MIDHATNTVDGIKMKFSTGDVVEIQDIHGVQQAGRVVLEGNVLENGEPFYCLLQRLKEIE
jgi:hypothetical protein